MADEPMEIFVQVTNPSDYARWSPEAKVDRLERTMEWHDYIRDLNAKGKMPWAWGSHKLTDATNPGTGVEAKAVVYKVSSLAEFNDLSDEDPLRDVSNYMTVPLTDLFSDFRTDNERLAQGKQQLFEGRSDVAQRVFDEARSQYFNAPSYVGNVERKPPANPPVDFDRHGEPGDKLEVLLYGQNPDTYIDTWTDVQRVIHWEKVMWWHDYTALMQERGYLSHVWGTHNFCASVASASRSAGAISILGAANWEEFDDLYKMDPIRETTIFISTALRPIADERRSDERRLAIGRQRAGKRTAISAR